MMMEIAYIYVYIYIHRYIYIYSKKNIYICSIKNYNNSDNIKNMTFSNLNNNINNIKLYYDINVGLSIECIGSDDYL